MKTRLTKVAEALFAIGIIGATGLAISTNASAQQPVATKTDADKKDDTADKKMPSQSKSL